MPNFAKLYSNLTTRNNVLSGYLFFNSDGKRMKTVRYIGVLNWVYVIVISFIISFILYRLEVKANVSNNR